MYVDAQLEFVGYIGKPVDPKKKLLKAARKSFKCFFSSHSALRYFQSHYVMTTPKKNLIQVVKVTAASYSFHLKQVNLALTFNLPEIRGHGLILFSDNQMIVLKIQLLPQNQVTLTSHKSVKNIRISPLLVGPGPSGLIFLQLCQECKYFNNLILYSHEVFSHNTSYP